MQIQRHAIPSPSTGTSRELITFHYGSAGQGKKVYIQSSLHADEIPGMLVIHHLRTQLDIMEKKGQILGEIVLVPVANPIGLSQVVCGMPFGRFDIATGINFNRSYRNLVLDLKQSLVGKLSSNTAENVHIIRKTVAQILTSHHPMSESEAMKNCLQLMAIDADIILDLHCENEGILHLYTGTPLAKAAAPLAALLGAQVMLLAQESGGDPFDETCSKLWWELAAHFGEHYPIPNACLSVTVELRGERDVAHLQAQQDATAILAFLAHSGSVNIPSPALPTERCIPTPLSGVELIHTPSAGMLIFLKNVGDYIEKGSAVADIVDPVSGETTKIYATVSGIMFARSARRYAHNGMNLAKIAGADPIRTGQLLTQ